MNQGKGQRKQHMERKTKKRTCKSTEKVRGRIGEGMRERREAGE